DETVSSKMKPGTRSVKQPDPIASRPVVVLLQAPLPLLTASSQMPADDTQPPSTLIVSPFRAGAGQTSAVHSGIQAMKGGSKPAARRPASTGVWVTAVAARALDRPTAAAGADRDHRCWPANAPRFVRSGMRPHSDGDEARPPSR